MSYFTQLSFSRKNAVFLAFCCGGLVLLFCVGVLPLLSQHKKLVQIQTEVTQQLAEQKQTQDNITLVDTILTQLDQQTTPQVVGLAPLPLDKTSRIAEDFRTIASASSLTVDRIDPLLENKTDWKSLSVKAECYGELDNIRIFLLKLLSLPYVRQIDRLELHPGSPLLRFTLTYTIDLA